jgi:hypothetical protein
MRQGAAAMTRLRGAWSDAADEVDGIENPDGEYASARNPRDRDPVGIFMRTAHWSSMSSAYRSRDRSRDRADVAGSDEDWS